MILKAEVESRKSKVTSAVAFVLLVAGCAVDPRITAARRIVDDAQPINCEVHALEERLKRAPEGSDEHARLAEELGEAKAEQKSYYVATMWEYIFVMKDLPREERMAILRYSDAFAERCPRQ